MRRDQISVKELNDTFDNTSFLLDSEGLPIPGGEVSPGSSPVITSSPGDPDFPPPGGGDSEGRGGRERR